MLLRQIYDADLSQYAYLIGCEKTREAIVIDPERDVDRYLEIAKSEGLTLNAVAETHIHADFVSGARELATYPATRVFLSAEGGPDWQSEWARNLANVTLLHDADTFKVGNIKFQALHTPGHTPEHLSYLVTDEGGGADEPIALLSGDCLFVGDAGRPDLLETAAGIAGTGEEGAHQLYSSLRRIASLPCHVQILPAHGSGSACGKSLGAVPSSTAGYEIKFNPTLKLAIEASAPEFADFILSNQPEPPFYFSRMKYVNRTGPALLGGVPQPRQLTIEEVIARLDDPTLAVLDTRADRAAFMKAHLRGSLYSPAKGSFSNFAGSFLKPDERIVLVVDSASHVEQQVRQLIRIGFDNIAGWLSVGALASANDALASTRSVKFREVSALIASDQNSLVLDVRGAAEHQGGHITGALNVPHTRLQARVAEVPANRTLIVHCQSGQRASAAAAYLERNGRQTVYVNDGFANVPGEFLE
jgi:hydroxyacylglutathione hydrolase